MKRLTLGVSLICFAMTLVPAKAQELLNLKNLKKEYSYKKANVKKDDTNTKAKVPQILNKETIRKDKLKLVYISNTNLFVKPYNEDYPQATYRNIWPFLREPALKNLDFISSEPYFYGLSEQGKNIMSQKLIPAPVANGAILYKESQLLLQEAIREVLKSLPLEAVDMVVFGGNQVYSSEQEELFLDIAVELQKYQVPYYQVVGERDIRGTIDIDKFIKDRYYMLKTKGTSILVLDNSVSEVVPVNVPEEATAQYIWLKSTLDLLVKTSDDVLIFSSNQLSQRDIEFLNLYPSLNLKLLAYSGPKINAYEDKGKSLIHTSNPIVLSNSMLSSYPCSYSVITRDSIGRYKIEEMPVDLPGIRELAKSRTSLNSK